MYDDEPYLNDVLLIKETAKRSSDGSALSKLPPPSPGSRHPAPHPGSTLLNRLAEGGTLAISRKRRAGGGLIMSHAIRTWVRVRLGASNRNKVPSMQRGAIPLVSNWLRGWCQEFQADECQDSISLARLDMQRNVLEVRFEHGKRPVRGMYDVLMMLPDLS